MSKIKLVAFDEEDLEVISSCCQDGVLKIGEMQYFAGERRFVLTLNRYVWENKKSKERRRSVLHFERVNGVKVSGINRNEAEMVTSLLAVMFEKTDAPGGTIELVFAGDGAIRLEVECIEAQLGDLDAAWEASSTPLHE